MFLENRINKLTFPALWIFCFDGDNLNIPGEIFYRLIHYLYGFGLIVFNTDKHPGTAGRPLCKSGACDDLPCPLKHNAIIARDIRLALAPVDNQYLFPHLRIRLYLYPRRKTRPPHTHNTRLTHRLAYLLRRALPLINLLL